VLTELQQRVLVDAARHAVAARVTGERLVPPAPADLPEASGVFVTVKHKGLLRGCLGTLDYLENLGADVVRCAADAASKDPRFSPVTPQELQDLSVEVSVLGPLERIDPVTPDAIVIGRHGLVIEQGERRGLLLPQVAEERHWTVEEFLSQTCVKARLAPDAWRHGAEVFRFEAQVFGD
jgi:AmmeMemoRadiSam system protein A